MGMYTRLKVTVSSLMEDIKNSFNSRDFLLPHNGYSVGREIIVHTRNGEIYPEDLVGFINFYLEKKSKDTEGEITVTTNEEGECVLVSRQDEDHKILKVIWEKK